MKSTLQPAYIIIGENMKEKTFKKAVYIVLFILIVIFFTKDCDFFFGFYKNIRQITNPDDILVLVNKNNKLSEDYIPKVLEAIDINYAMEEKYVRKEVKSAFEALAKKAKEEGYQIVAVSAFRSYSYQDELYHSYVKTSGKAYADRCSARPGHSEHQTGLAIDVMGENQDYNKFAETKEFQWMLKHAHEYGFILRYPEKFEDVTGFKYEPWHYRYVGIDAAKKIKEKNTCLELYLH